jgi:hypothetical protein
MASGISGYGLQVGGRGISSTAGSVGSGIRSPVICASDFSQRLVPRDNLVFWCMCENGSRAKQGVKDNQNRVSLIRDFSGKGNHLRQSSNGRMPSFATYNGQKTFYFDGSDISSSPGTSQFDFGAGDFTIVLATYAISQSGTRATLTNRAEIGSDGFIVGRVNKQWLFGTKDSGGASTLITSSNHHSVWNVVLARRSGTSMTLQVWTAGSLSEEVSGTKAVRNVDAVQLSIGASLNISNLYNGGISEAFVYKKALTTAEQERMLTYLTAKFA